MTDIMPLPANDTAAPATAEHKMTARAVNVFYGTVQAIRDVSIDIDMDHVTAFIGRRAAASRPSCARSTG